MEVPLSAADEGVRLGGEKGRRMFVEWEWQLRAIAAVAVFLELVSTY